MASLSQGRTAAAQCGLFTHKSVPVIFEPPCIPIFIFLDSKVGRIMERMTPDIPKRTVTTNSKSVLNLNKNQQASYLKYIEMSSPYLYACRLVTKGYVYKTGTRTVRLIRCQRQDYHHHCPVTFLMRRPIHGTPVQSSHALGCTLANTNPLPELRTYLAAAKTSHSIIR